MIREEYIRKVIDKSSDGPERCPECGRQITVGPSGIEYGHERGSPGETGKERCPRRPDCVDPGRDGPDHDDWCRPGGRGELTAEWQRVRDDSDIVYVIPGSGTYHSDPECQYLNGKTFREPAPKPISVIPHRRPCSGCCPDEEPARPQPDRGAADFVVDRRRRIYNLIDKDGPISRREIQLEANESDRVSLRTVRWLLKRNVIREVDNPDDGRIPLYDTIDGVPLHDVRGQAQPLAIGVLTLLVGVLLLIGMAIIHGGVV